MNQSPRASDSDEVEGSSLTRLITDEMVLYDKKSDKLINLDDEDKSLDQRKIDIYKLITLGTILCFGDDLLKAKVIYNVMQINMSDFAVLNDRM
jgi:hypothetical protein